MTKTEQIARAIYAANNWWSAVKESDDGKGRYDNRGGIRMRAVEWEQLDEDERVQRLRDARIAIETMRVPTDAIMEAGNTAVGEFFHRHIEVARWQAMIDAALGEDA